MKQVYLHSMSALNPQCIFREEVERKFPVGKRLYVDDPDYKMYIRDAGLRRRMSRMVKMGVAAAIDCLEQADGKEMDAILTATGMGCIGDTERFINAICEQDEHLLNPTPFIQSTFNTIGAQIALLCRNHHYNMTYVHRGLSFESALLDAQLLIGEGEARQVLVGAVDELTDSEFRVMERMGYWRTQAVAGEGAHFFVLSEECHSENPVLLKGMLTFSGILTTEEIKEKIDHFLHQQQLEKHQISLLMTGRTGIGEMEKSYPAVCHDGFTGVTEFCFKPYSGEYPTASAFAMWWGALWLKGEKKGDIPVEARKNVLIYNTYMNTNHALILLAKS